jgi:hypothetical protein
MLNVVMLSVVMLSVFAPSKLLFYSVVFVTDKFFCASLIFVGKARAYLRSISPKFCEQLFLKSFVG